MKLELEANLDKIKNNFNGCGFKAGDGKRRIDGIDENYQMLKFRSNL
jgi:archaellum component FlaC